LKVNTQITVNVDSKGEEYIIHLGDNTIIELPDFLNKSFKNYKIVIITDENVEKYHLTTIENILSEFSIFVITIKPGEHSKSREIKNEIDDKLLEKQFGRDTVILALGGGVVGDLAGFVASTYKRGVPVVQIPTSMLAMVDSSVGGKTAVNTKYGKNLIGTFWPPKAVFADLNLLETLPDIEFLNGFAESLKMAIILDNDLFKYIEDNSKKILLREKKVIFHIIKRCVELKREVVSQDEQERGLRQILNYGHTIGHAVETLSKYEVKHGFAVSIGMAVETILGVIAGYLSKEEGSRIISLIDDLQMPSKIDNCFTEEDIFHVMKSDKKSVNGIPKFNILRKIGEIKEENGKFSIFMEKEQITEAIQNCRKK